MLSDFERAVLCTILRNQQVIMGALANQLTNQGGTLSGYYKEQLQLKVKLADEIWDQEFRAQQRRK